MKKLAFCIAQTYVPGGTQRVLANKINYFEKDEFEFHIITTDQHGNPPFFPMNGSVFHHDLGINYDEYAISRSMTRVWKALQKRINHYKQLKELITTIEPDVIVSMGGAETTFLPSIKRQARIIYESHFHRYYKLQSSRKLDPLTRARVLLETTFEDVYLKNFDRVILLTQRDQKNYPKLKNTVVIPNSLSKIPEKTSELHKKQVLAIGRLTYQKGFDLLIQAWHLVHQKLPEWKLVIIGSGEDEPMLRGIIQELALDGSVVIKPPTNQIEEEYLNSSMFVLSSRYEGFGLVLIEAMSYGLPCVSFDCACGPSEIIMDNVTGYLAQPESISDLVIKISLIANQHLLLHKMARSSRKISRSFSDEVIAEKYRKDALGC